MEHPPQRDNCRKESHDHRCSCDQKNNCGFIAMAQNKTHGSISNLKLIWGTALSADEAAKSVVSEFACTRTFPMCVPGVMHTET